MVEAIYTDGPGDRYREVSAVRTGLGAKIAYAPDYYRSVNFMYMVYTIY